MNGYGLMVTALTWYSICGPPSTIHSDSALPDNRHHRHHHHHHRHRHRHRHRSVIIVFTLGVLLESSFLSLPAMTMPPPSPWLLLALVHYSHMMMIIMMMTMTLTAMMMTTAMVVIVSTTCCLNADEFVASARNIQPSFMSHLFQTCLKTLLNFLLFCHFSLVVTRA